MFIGHYAPAFVAATSRRSPKLGTLFVAAQLIDISFFSLLLLGAEHMRLVPGATRMNPMDLYDMPWDHSLVGALGWALGFGLVIRLLSRKWTASAIGAAIVLSHWFIDLLVHRPDLTIAGRPPLLGLGLWNHPAIEVPLELLFAFGGLWWFVLRTRATSAAGRWSPVVLAFAMAALQAFNWLAPQPTAIIDPAPASTGALGLFAYALLCFIAWWVARTRQLS